MLETLALVACGSSGGASTQTSDASPIGAADAGAGECTTNRECVDQHAAHWICRKPTQTCVSLLSPECTLVRGNDAADDAVIVGVLAPDFGLGQYFGLADLARADFTEELGGVFVDGEDKPRPFVLVGCKYPFEGDPLPAARRLIDDIGVPAVIGPASSPDVINVAQNVAIPAGALLMTPSAQSDVLSSLRDQDLVFRTTPATRAIAPQLTAMVSDLESQVRTERAEDDASDVKVALIATRDSYGIALSTALSELLRWNGGRTATENERLGDFMLVTFNPTEQGFEPELTTRVVDFAPDVTLVLTGADIRAFRAIAQAWPSASNVPYYVMDAAAGGAELTEVVAAQPDALRRHIRIVSHVDASSPRYRRFAQRIEEAFGSSSLLVLAVSAYDAAYAVAYGIVAASQEPLSGHAIARGLRKLVGGTHIAVFPDQIQRGASILRSGKRIDLDGASGALDFDDRGDVTADGFVDCLVRNQRTGQISRTSSGQVYRTNTGKLEGSFDCK